MFCKRLPIPPSDRLQLWLIRPNEVMLPSELSFYIGPTEFQNTLLSHAQEYVGMFFRYIHLLSNQLIEARTGFEPVRSIILFSRVSNSFCFPPRCVYQFRHLAIFVKRKRYVSTAVIVSSTQTQQNDIKRSFVYPSSLTLVSLH